MTQVRCCKCNTLYSIKLFEIATSGLPIIVCPQCGMVHTVKFDTVDHLPSKSPIEEIKLGTYYPNIIGTDGVNNAHVSADLATPAKHASSPTLTDWVKTNKIWIGIKVGCNNCTKTPVSVTGTLQVRRGAGGTWYNLGANTGGNSLDWPGTGNMNYTTLTPPNGIWWTANDTGLCNTNRANGVAQDNSASLTVPALAADEKVELWWAVDLQYGDAGQTYYFGAYDSHGDWGTAGSPAVLAVTITLATVASLTIDVSDGLSNKETLD